MRREDVEPLVIYFLHRYAEQNRRDVRRIEPEAMRLLREHEWPGNVRELQNYIERAVILGTGPELTVENLPPQLRGQTTPRPIRPRTNSDQNTLCTELVRHGISSAGPQANDLHERIVGRVERELIQQVLQTCERVQIKAAARLGINRNTLHKKLTEYRLDESDLRTAAEPFAPNSGHRTNDGATDETDQNNSDQDNSRSRTHTGEPASDWANDED